MSTVRAKAHAQAGAVLSPEQIADRDAMMVDSAIITVGELVLPEVMVGITEASMTRKADSPMTLNRASNSAIDPIDLRLTGTPSAPTQPVRLSRAQHRPSSLQLPYGERSVGFHQSRHD